MHYPKDSDSRKTTWSGSDLEFYTAKVGVSVHDCKNMKNSLRF